MTAEYVGDSLWVGLGTTCPPLWTYLATISTVIGNSTDACSLADT
jgi:hypothetical protein